MKRSPRRGLTLAEVTVCCFLGSMLMTSIYGIFASSMRYSQTTHAAVDLQSAALQTVRKIVGEVSNSDFGTVSAPSGANALIFASAQNGLDQFPQDAGTFGNLWQSWVCYWADADGRLHRAESPISPTAAAPPTASSAPSLAAMQTISSRVVATNVDMGNSQPLLFTLQAVGSSGRVSIVANFAETLQTTNRCQIEDEVYCRN